MKLLPRHVKNMQGEPPTIDLMMGYNNSNMSPWLKRFPSRIDESAGRVSQKTRHPSRLIFADDRVQTTDPRALNAKAKNAAPPSKVNATR